MKHRWLHRILHGFGIAMLVAAAALSIAAIRPPDVAPPEAPAPEFSAARAIDHLRVIARAPHPLGTPAHEQVREYLVHVLSELGLETEVQSTSVSARFAGNFESALVKNVLARLKGTGASARSILLAAHYDSVPMSFGASDDGSGVVTLLETARALRARSPLECDVLFLFTDGEELGMLGAHAFVAEHAAAREVALALNFEARGSHGAVAMFDTSPGNGALISALSAAEPHLVASSFVSTLAQTLPNDTDASIFKKAGMPVLGFAYADGLENYHVATDSIDTIDPRSVQHHGAYALALVEHFGQSDSSHLVAPDLVYFDVLSRLLV